MSAERIPESWVGQQIEAMIVQANPTVRGRPLTALELAGTLESVNSMGMVALLTYDPDDPEEPPPESTFYPWSTVLWLRLVPDD
jgi:hypothetical protein